MGNSQCAPRVHGENVKDFLRRKFSCVSRKRRIDDLVILAIQGEEKEFKTVAGRVKLTKPELARFYEERDAVVDEFDDDVMEIEMCKFGHETPSEYSDSDVSDYSETPSNSPVVTPKALMYSDPVNQKLFEEYCEVAWDMELELISLSDLPEIKEYKSIADMRIYKTKQHLLDNMAIGACNHDEKKRQGNAKAQSNVVAKNPDTLKKVVKVAKEMGGGEKPRINHYTREKIACKIDVGDDRIENAKAHTLESNTAIERAGETSANYTAQSVSRKRRFLEKITEGLRQREGTRTRATSNLTKREIETESVKATYECLDKDVETGVSKKKNKDIKRGFFRRVAAKFRRSRSSRLSSNNVIHVQPAKSDTDFMPLQGGM